MTNGYSHYSEKYLMRQLCGGYWSWICILMSRSLCFNMQLLKKIRMLIHTSNLAQITNLFLWGVAYLKFWSYWVRGGREKRGRGGNGGTCYGRQCWTLQNLYWENIYIFRYKHTKDGHKRRLKKYLLTQWLSLEFWHFRHHFFLNLSSTLHTSWANNLIYLKSRFLRPGQYMLWFHLDLRSTTLNKPKLFKHPLPRCKKRKGWSGKKSSD